MMLKKSLLLAGILMFVTCLQGFSQKGIPKFLQPKGDAGYMGLWDWGFSAGYFNHYQHNLYPTSNYKDIKLNGEMLSAHISESVLSNYIWSGNQDKKIKFGIIETLEIGVGHGKVVETSSDASYLPTLAPVGKFVFLFTYEAGLGAVYKISEKMDAGLNFYILSLSTFNKDQEKRHYPKLRFRYSHLMTELSLGQKTAIDLKYLKGSGDRSYSPYYGISYTGWKTEDTRALTTKSARYLYLTIGSVF